MAGDELLFSYVPLHAVFQILDWRIQGAGFFVFPVLQ
jgi:hypothetical protein